MFYIFIYCSFYSLVALFLFPARNDSISIICFCRIHSPLGGAMSTGIMTKFV